MKLMSLSRRMGRAKFSVSCKSFIVIIVVNLIKNIFIRQRDKEGSLVLLIVFYVFGLRNIHLKKDFDSDFESNLVSLFSVLKF